VRDGGSSAKTPQENGSGGKVVPPQVPTPAPTAGGCQPNMVFIAAGSFKMGSKEDDPLMGWDDKPLSHRNTAAYCIDQYEHPNQEGQKPLVNVTFNEAAEACKAQGKRLCSEEEWERACKGPTNSRFTWGDTRELKNCNMEKSAAASGSF